MRKITMKSGAKSHTRQMQLKTTLVNSMKTGRELRLRGANITSLTSIHLSSRDIEYRQTRRDVRNVRLNLVSTSPKKIQPSTRRTEGLTM